jgi:hypothetical protein
VAFGLCHLLPGAMASAHRQQPNRAAASAHPLECPRCDAPRQLLTDRARGGWGWAPQVGLARAMEELRQGLTGRS